MTKNTHRGPCVPMKLGQNFQRQRDKTLAEDKGRDPKNQNGNLNGICHEGGGGIACH